MKIFLIGSSGFIGRNLLEFLEKKGHTITCFFRHNIIDIKEQLLRARPDVIINCAGEIYDESKMVASNVLLVNAILEYMTTNYGVYASLIHLGSSSEYGKVDHATKETDPINPTNFYAATKGAATLLVQGLSRKYNLDAVIIRPYSVYGPNDNNNKLMHRLWEVFTDTNSSLELVPGNHDWIYIDDFIEGVYRVMLSNERVPGEIINLGSGKQTDNFEVYKIFCRLFNRNPDNIKMNIFNHKRDDSATWIADISHATNKYSFKPTTSLEQGIREIINKEK